MKGRGGGTTTGGSLEEVVHELRTGPLLVGEGLDTVHALLVLDHLDVGEHTILASVGLGGLVDGEGVGVESKEGDEVPGDSELAELTLEVADVIVRTGDAPVEAGAQVVGDDLLRDDGVDTVGELGDLGDRRGGGLAPDHVRDRGEGNGADNGVVDATDDTEESLAGAGCLLAPEDVAESELGGEGLGVLVGELHGVLHPLVDEVALAGLLHGGGDGIGVAHESGRLHPGDGVSGVDRASNVGVGGTGNEGVVTGVDVVLEEVGRVGIGTAHEHEGVLHDISLETGSGHAVSVLTDGDKDLASKVTALLGANLLVLKVNSGGTRLDHHLDELGDGGHATKTSVTVGDDGAEVVNLGGGGLLLGRHLGAGVTLLASVELLGLEELVDLVREGVGGVVSKVRAGLVAGGGGGGCLPSRDVDGLKVLVHLHELHGVEAAEGAGELLLVEASAAEVVELGGKRSVHVLSRGEGSDVTAESDDLLGGVRALGVLEALRGHPLLHLLELLGHDGVIVHVEVHHFINKKRLLKGLQSQRTCFIDATQTKKRRELGSSDLDGLASCEDVWGLLMLLATFFAAAWTPDPHFYLALSHSYSPKQRL